jgi:prepilin-type processing-associated H-X9-DG protein
MRSPRIGLLVHDDRLTVVGIAGRDRVEHFTVEGAEDPAAKLAAELQACGLGAGRIRVGLDRRPAVVKVIELPRAAGSDLAQMVAFDLERHVPFAPEDTRFDWVELASGPAEPHRVLVAAAERRAVERPLALLAGAGRRPASLTVACHDLPALLPRALPARHVVWAHRHGGGADLLFLDGRALLTSRQVVAAGVEGLAREITRSLGVAGWTACDAVWLSGDDAPAWRGDLAAALRIAVSAPPYAPSSAPLIAALPAHGAGAALLALGVAVAPRAPLLDLLPADLRPRTLSRAQLATAALVAAVACLGLGLAFTHVIRTERYLARLTQEIRRLEPEAKAVDALAAELARKKRLVAAIESVQDDQVQALPVLREMTETLPASAWLQALVMDRLGVELTGQSDAASTLIPLLEASSRLERVEFTSPVTKVQNKEQFRIRASWERAPKGR